MIDEPLPAHASSEARAQRHAAVLLTVKSLLADEEDWIAALATIACELHHAFEGWHWTGFYRVVAPDLLKV
ncbi:MAG: GAF domain-containing protein, partial [Myxococcota bacterium]